MLTANLSGFRSDIVEGLLRGGFSFLFLQETHHFESSKFIFDSSNMYKTFHVSSMDEGEPNLAHVGGIVIYVNNDIVTPTEVVAKCKYYLITCTGKLVCVNVYLPHANHPVGLEVYDTLLGEIACFIHAFLFIDKLSIVERLFGFLGIVGRLSEKFKYPHSNSLLNKNIPFSSLV